MKNMERAVYLARKKYGKTGIFRAKKYEESSILSMKKNIYVKSGIFYSKMKIILTHRKFIPT